MDKEIHYIFFDGECGLCNKSVMWVYKNDKRKVFTFVALQSALGQQTLKQLNLHSSDFETFIYQKGNRFFYKSEAAINVTQTLGGIWKIFFLAKIFPLSFRDAIYNWIAKNRNQLGFKSCDLHSIKPERFVMK